jgi:hypothetical protein
MKQKTWEGRGQGVTRAFRVWTLLDMAVASATANPWESARKADSQGFAWSLGWLLATAA